MNLNVWNIKDMFSVPPGAGLNKSANRSAAQSDHSSLSDSQFLFSSQFYPDNSQQGSMDYTPQPKYQRNSNQNSQDSEPSMYQKYQSKPPLCISEPKERSTFQPFGLIKSKDIIEQFEESKRRVKEKHESEQLQQLICNIQGALQDLKVPFLNIEETTNLRCQSILENIDAVYKALQDKLSSYHESMLNAVPLKSDLQQAMVELEKKIRLKDVEMTDLKSNIQLLLLALDAIKLQQSEKHLELSEKITQLSDSMQTSEQRILSEIRNNKLISQQTRSSANGTTQTSPISVQDLSAKEHLASQYRTISTCPDGPSPFTANVPCTCCGISNALPVQHGGNPCATEVTGRKTFNITFAKSIRDTLTDQRRWKKAITADHTAGTYAHILQHLCQDDRGTLVPHDNPSRNTRHYTEQENLLTVARSNGENNSSKGPQTNESKISMKKRTKNTKQAPSRAINAKHTPGNKPVTRRQANSAKATQDSFALFSQTCASSSLTETSKLLRKTKKKNSLKFSHLQSPQIIEHSKINEASSGDRSRFAKAEQELEHCEVSPGDSNNLHCSKSSGCEEDKIVWFPSSSPLHNYSSNPHALNTDQKDFLTFLFNSSDDTD